LQFAPDTELVLVKRVNLPAQQDIRYDTCKALVTKGIFAKHN